MIKDGDEMKKEINEFTLCCRYVEAIEIMKSRGFDVNTYHDKIQLISDSMISREFNSVSDFYFYALGFIDRAS